MSILSGPTKIAFGFGMGVLAAGVFKGLSPAFQGLGRPLLKAAVKSGLILAQDGRVKIAEFRETLADVTAEAKHELRDPEPEIPLHPPFTEPAKQQAEVM